YNGNWIVRILMDEIFGKENFRNEIIASTTKGKTKGEGYQFTKAKDSIFLYSSTKNFRLYHCWADTEYKKLVQILKEKNLLNNSKINEIFWTPLGTRVGERATSSKLTVFGIDIFASEGRHWELNQKRITELETKGKIRLKCKKCGFIITNQISKNNHLCKEMDWDIECFYDEKLIDENWTDIPGYSQTWGFSTENSEMLLKRVIESTSKEGDLVMDFFLGSGTTTAVAHKLKRKWIGVEMGEHFKEFYKGSKFSQKLKKEIIIDKIGILGRMKKVLYYDKSGISKEKDVKEKYNENTAGGFFKYQILEQYEDALDNIELKENKQIESLFKDEYLLKYFLEFETRESPYLLNIEYLKNPFAYKLKVNLSEVGEPQEMIIDIPETFNYLLGIKVKKIKTRKDNGKKYLFILGEKEGRNYAIVWREYKDNEQEEDLKKDNDFIQSQIKDWNPNIVYVNGKSCLTPEGFEVKYIEPEFKKLMER
ncbi:MAG: site-specific DNA-methyltransferase, partial [candidate division WOR-3 bacterium]